MIGQPVTTKVLLPERLFREATDKEHLKQLVLEYMARYEGYKVKSIKDGFAFCEVDRRG